MRKSVKVAVGTALVIFVAFECLSVLLFLAATAAGHFTRDTVVANADVPAAAVAKLPGQPAIVDDVWPVDTSTQWGAPAQIRVDVGESWLDIAASFAGLILLVGMLAILAIVIRSVMRGKSAPSSDETALVHELARRAQDLAQRMEALETILLDRTRTTR